MITETEFQQLYKEAQRKQAEGDFGDALNDYLELAENVVRVKLKWYCSDPIWSVYSADIDGDGRVEIIAGSTGGNVYALASDGRIKWKCNIGNSVRSVFCADVDNDGQVEVVAASYSNIYLLTGNGKIKWKYETGDTVTSIYCTDVDNNGRVEIIAGSDAGNVYLLTSDRKIEWEFRTGDIVKDVFCADVDNDGQVEIIAGSYDKNVYLLASNGEVRWKYKTSGCVASVFCADVDNDGQVEIIAGSYDRNVYLLTSDGKIKWKCNIGNSVRSVFCADVDNDGQVEVVAASYSNIYLLTSNGKIKWKFRTSGRVAKIFCADIDDDGQIEIIARSLNNSIYALSIIDLPAMHELISPVWAQVEDSGEAFKLARSESQYLRGYALRRLAQSDEATKLLKAAIHDEEIYVRKSCVKALSDYAEHNADEAFAMLEELYQERDEELRREIISTLANLASAGYERAFPLIEKLAVFDLYKVVKRDAIYALGELSEEHREKSFEILKRFSSDEDDWMQHETARALTTMFSHSADDVLIKVRELFRSGCKPKVFDYLSELISIYIPRSTLPEIFLFYYEIATLKDISKLFDVLNRGINILEQSEKQSENWMYADELRMTYDLLLKLLKLDSAEDISQKPKLLHKFSDDDILYTEHKGAFQRIEQIIESVSRVEQLEKLQDQILTFNQAINRIRGAKNYVSEQIKLPFPFNSILDKWEGIVSEASRKIMGRASIVSELASERLLRESQVLVPIRLINEGVGPASSIQVKLQNTGDFDYVDGDTKMLDFLDSGGANAEVQFTVAPRRADTLRISAEITFDDLAEASHTTYLGGIIDFIERTVEFEEIENPYSPGGALKEYDEVFYGRRDVFDFINSNLSNSTRDGISILYGQRKSGKSSILGRVSKKVKPGYIPVYVSVQALSKNIFYYLAYFIRRKLSAKGYEVAPPKLSDYDGVPFVAFNEFIDAISQKLESQNVNSNDKEKLLLMIDEFDLLGEKVGDGEQKEELFGHLRYLAQHRNDVLSFIFAGTHRLREMGSEYQSILFNIGGRYCEIDALSEAEARALITEPVKGKLEYEDQAVESIINATGCYPYFVQLVCWNLVEQANANRDNYVSVNTVENVLKSLTTGATADGHLQYLWDIFDASKHAVEAIMADVLIYQPDQIDFNSLSRTLVDAGVELSDKELRAVLNELCREDILEEIGQGEWYKFKFDLMRIWLRANKPPKKTLQEEGL